MSNIIDISYFLPQTQGATTITTDTTDADGWIDESGQQPDEKRQFQGESAQQ